VTVGNEIRNVAGLVTQQKSTLSGGAMTSIESDWSYDKLGRVTNQTVSSAPNARAIARENLAYAGNDDPLTMDQYLGANPTHFAYTYDYRHQLTGVTTPSNFAGTYAYGAAGRFTHATESIVTPAPGSEVAPRNVDYQYAGSDPEEVTGLIDVTTTQPYATYTYDPAGNQLTKSFGPSSPNNGITLTYLYDGKNQLRRATKTNLGTVVGSEEYWYDGKGKRNVIAKRDAAGTLTEVITSSAKSRPTTTLRAWSSRSTRTSCWQMGSPSAVSFAPQAAAR